VQFLKYTFWRAVIFAVAWAVLWLWWGDAFLSAIVALLISGIASYFLLRRQRDALADQIQARASRAVKNSEEKQANEDAKRAEVLDQLDDDEHPVEGTAIEHPVDHGDEQQR
jgi:Protein of unknown function (DUF4229)